MKISQLKWLLFPQVPRTPRPGMESADSRRLATKHSRKALKASLTLGVLLGMFFVTWMPFFVANIAQVKKKKNDSEGGTSLNLAGEMPCLTGQRWEGGGWLICGTCVCVCVSVLSLLGGVVWVPAWDKVR